MTVSTHKAILSGISALLSLLLYTLPSYGQALQAIAYVPNAVPSSDGKAAPTSEFIAIFTVLVWWLWFTVD